MIYFLLCWEFLKIGLFAIGGGLAAIPFLFALSDKYGWFSHGDLLQFIAISEITPGPLGINMATFVGYTTAGIMGGLLASIAIALPSLLIILLLCHFIPNYQNNSTIQKVFYGMYPVACALIAVTGWRLFQPVLLYCATWSLTIWSWALFIILVILWFKQKTNPFSILGISATWGLFFL